MNRSYSNIEKIPLIILLSLGFAFYFFLYKNLQIISPFPEDKPVLIIENQVFLDDIPFIIENNHVLISYDIIKDNLDPYIFWDSSENNIIITTYNKTVRLATESLTAMINTKPVEISFPAKVSDKPYIPIRLLEDLYDIKVKVLPDKNRVIIDKNLKTWYVGTVKANTAMKQSPSWFSSRITKLSSGDTLSVYDHIKGWYQVRTSDGLLGYIPEKNLEVSKVHKNQEAKPDKAYKPGRGKLNMVWDYIHSITPDKTGEIPPKGLDIISPTWFSITDGKGTIKSKADIAYIEWAHKNNLAVWALIDNSFDPDITHEFLSSSETRDKLIRQILMYADLFHLDGINIDFENVYLKDKELLVQFIRELTPVLREAGITVSMDVTVKSTSENWSLFYDRRELGKVLDYVVLMAYDEHWATSPVSGSVASIGWVERGIVSLLEDVPAEKIILGLPFYTREWQEAPAENGQLKVKSKAISMNQAKQILKKNNAPITWDEQAGQNFAYYTKGDSVFKIWLEDERSIQLKTELVNKYDLAGASAWRKDFEEPEIWEVIYENLKQPSKI